jgi:hypothetical protein
LLLPAVLISTLGAAYAAPQQYAFQAELSDSKQALQRVELSLDILLAVTRADLGDVSVFDASGKPLPSWIRKATIRKTQKQFSLPIYLFNTYQQSSSKTITTREQNQDQDRLSESTTTEIVPIEKARQDYLIELPEADADLKISSIELIWTHEPADQLLQLRIDAGSDLDSWRTIQSKKSLTNQFSDDAQWRTIIDIPEAEKYLRLTPINSIRSFELTQAIGTYREKVTERKIWHQLGELQKTSNQQGHLKFDMPSPAQALELKLIPVDEQSLINGDLFASQTDFDQKRLIGSNIQQHNISGGEIKPSKPIRLPMQNYVHWWFKPNRPPTSPIQAEIAFPVYELLFLGNDNSPFTLAWGNHESEAPSNDLISILNPEQRQRPASELVQLRAVQIAGGESRLSAPVKTPWLKWILWLLLAAAVFTTGKMALSLYRDMNAE